MRRLLLLIMVLSIRGIGAQDYTHDLTGITKVVISVETDVFLKTHSEPTLLIKESENTRNKRPEKAKGLTSLTTPAQDNTNYGVAVKQNGSQLRVIGLRDRLAPALKLRLPPDMNISVEVLVNNDISITGFQSEIEASNHLGEITLIDVTGPVVAENNNGNTLVVYSTINQASPSSLVSTNGDIEIQLPADADVSISSQTPRGDFYTDFDIELTGKRNTRGYNRAIIGKINNGGVSLDLQSIHGNIYLRKIE